MNEIVVHDVLEQQNNVEASMGTIQKTVLHHLL